ncbi:MAG: hypothetical protein NVS9B9_31020 [Ktedonobacteraceae bacterium]
MILDTSPIQILRVLVTTKLSTNILLSRDNLVIYSLHSFGYVVFIPENIV